MLQFTNCKLTYKKQDLDSIRQKVAKTLRCRPEELKNLKIEKKSLDARKKPAAILGFNTASEIFYKEEFEALGIETILATADGSVGSKGFVTDALPEAFDTFCACGPMPMLRALCARTEKPGFLSLEARMGCGFGACMGCTIETAHGPKRICKEGPVFRKEELIW